MPGFTVAIVGRPNVGKSTLFNRLLEQRKAIVDDVSGVTRDRQYGIAEWNGKTFNIIDTGGFVASSDDIFEREIRKQVQIAIEEANLIIFVCDTMTGITGQDEDMALILRRSPKPVLLVVNKVDNAQRALLAHEFWGLGFDQTFFLSSISGSGTGELLDALTDLIPEELSNRDQAMGRRRKKAQSEETPDEVLEAELDAEADTFSETDEDTEESEAGFEEGTEADETEWTEDEAAELEEEFGSDEDVEEEEIPALPKFAIVGQPNAGKSTLLNALIGQDRTIVSDIPGTTRDTIHTDYRLFGKEFTLIDTAGLRKKKNVHEDLEFYSVIRAIRALDEADVCFIVIDAEKGVTAQDINIFSLAARKGKGVVLLVNKWDLVEKETNTARDYERIIKQRIAPFTDVPVIFISAMEKKRIFQAMEKGLEVYESRKRRIPTSKLNEIMLKEIQHFQPPMSRGQAVKIKFVRQLPTGFITFAFYSNYPDAIKDSYKNFLENKLRSHFNFSGVPIRIYFRKK